MSAPHSPALTIPALHASHAGIWLRDSNGATRACGKGEAVAAATDTPLLLMNAPVVASRLGYSELSGLDLLELFAFIYPARFCVPTPRGLAEALALDPPQAEDAVPLLLQRAAATMLAQCETEDWPEREGAWSTLQSLQKARWPWAQRMAPVLARPPRAEKWLFSRLPEWEEKSERPAPLQITLSNEAIDSQLSALTGAEGEQRPGQLAYARAAGRIFAPRPSRDMPNMLLAEAGTGIGKTLGYLAPASLWADAADGTVWVSTYTKNLQRQLRQEARKAWPDTANISQPGTSDQPRQAVRQKVVVRKGRENYLCLLNLEDAMQGGFGGRAAVLAQLVARWAAYSRDGDIIGGDLPGWLTTLFRKRAIASLTDQRGECIYAACPHYRKCFIERSIRASSEAELVIANHALVMVTAARGGGQGQTPTRIVFDEGHHVFDAADATFSAALTGAEAVELRRWVLGPERKGSGRRRGLVARLADIASYDDEAGLAIAGAVEAAEALPSTGWLQRLADETPSGPIETLLAAVRSATYARDESGGREAGYGIETEIADLPGPLIALSQETAAALSELRGPLMQLGARLEVVIAEAPDWLDGHARSRIEGARHALGWRTDLLAAWIALLNRIGGPADPEFVDWLAVDRSDSREYDVGIYRHWLDPMKPFAKAVLEPAHGVMITSATLTASGEPEASEATDSASATNPSGPNWDMAIARTGAAYLPRPPETIYAPSPFDYANRAEVLIVNDIKKGNVAALSGAYARIIEASGGGVLGLFTAIRRLRAVYGHIGDRIARAGLPLYAQHADPIDTGTLVDMFRDDPHASLLGTDALRDGVDVPGESLRCVVMEQVPWPRPTILHRARRMASRASGASASAYDDRVIRARLAQAFGRLIRSSSDKGHFVVLSSAFPSRLLSAFPDGTPITRLPLDQALDRITAARQLTAPADPVAA